jgi:hypothetical protein
MLLNGLIPDARSGYFTMPATRYNAIGFSRRPFVDRLRCLRHPLAWKSIGYRFCQMYATNIGASVQVCERARYSQHSMVSAGRKAEFLTRFRKQRYAR